MSMSSGVSTGANSNSIGPVQCCNHICGNPTQIVTSGLGQPQILQTSVARQLDLHQVHRQMRQAFEDHKSVAADMDRLTMAISNSRQLGVQQGVSAMILLWHRLNKLLIDYRSDYKQKNDSRCELQRTETDYILLPWIEEPIDYN